MSTQKKIGERKAAQARTTLNAYRRLFSTEDGQIVLKDLMRSSFFFTPSIGQDVNQTYFNEGSRATVLRIMTTSKMHENQIEQLAQKINEENDSVYLD